MYEIFTCRGKITLLFGVAGRSSGAIINQNVAPPASDSFRDKIAETTLQNIQLIQLLQYVADFPGNSWE